MTGKMVFWPSRTALARWESRAADSKVSLLLFGIRENALDFQLTDEQSQLQHLIGRFLSGSYGEGTRARYRAADIG